MKAPNRLYLLAGEQDFRLIRATGGGLVEIARHEASDFADDLDSFGAPAGRSQSGGVSFGNTDRGAHDAERLRRFARHAVAALETEWTRAKDDGIVLVAGPKMLGALRDLMPKALARAVVQELAKDLVKLALHDLTGHLEDLPGF